MTNTIVKKNGNFTAVPNQLLNSSIISLSAKGIYSFMRSKPDNWNFTIRSMAKQLKEGQTAISSALKELKEHGWVSYVKNQDGTGVYTLEWSVSPMVEPNTENPDMENPKMGKPTRISNKDSLEINNSNNKYISFDDFWAIYPRREGKAKAKDLWCKLKVTSETFDKIKKHIALAYTGQDKRFIPFGSTYVSQRRWEDDVQAHHSQNSINTLPTDYSANGDTF